jgi:hypothetical protein
VASGVCIALAYGGHRIGLVQFETRVAACADVRDIEALRVEEDDPDLNPMGSKRSANST